MENTQLHLTNNSVSLCGKIASDMEFSHRVYDESFYSFFVENNRLSENIDTLPVIISEKLLTTPFEKGDYISIKGQIRSHNSVNGIKTHLVLSVFVKDIEPIDDYENITNKVSLDGYICKTPVYRVTPFGREIADVLLAVNRAYGKSDYIPTICWGRNAKFVSSLDVGANIVVGGRMQSRQYQKRLEDDQIVTKTAYEVSATKLELKE